MVGAEQTLTPECASGGSLQEPFQLFNSLIEKGFANHQLPEAPPPPLEPPPPENESETNWTNWTNWTNSTTRNPMS